MAGGHYIWRYAVQRRVNGIGAVPFRQRHGFLGGKMLAI